MLTSGKTLFTAILPQGVAQSDPGPWRIGSKLRVTGICSVRLDAQGNVRQGVAVTKSFRVLLRTPADVAILRNPSWWTAEHLLIILATVLTGTLAVLIWVVVLRRRVEQQTDLLRASEQRYRHLAQHDALTGLATRVVLRDRLNEAFESCQTRGTGLGILMLDVDNFKRINDTFGHQAGDEVLRCTANRLLETVRATDTVVRMGGDEFVVLLTDLREPILAENVAGAIVDGLARPIPFQEVEIQVSVSVGVCASFTRETPNVEEILKRADAALYCAKAQGRHCFQVFALDQNRAPILSQSEPPVSESGSPRYA